MRTASGTGTTAAPGGERARLAATLATLATLPLIAADFGRISLVALPANLLLVPLFPIVLATSALTAL